MPGLVLFRRRWTAGSDDFVFPGILLAVLHFILFIVSTVYVSSSPVINHWASINPVDLQHRNANQSAIDLAKCAKTVEDYSFGFVAVLLCALLLEIIMSAFSMQGTIIDTAPRKPVQYVLYIRLALGAAELFYSVAVVVHLSTSWLVCSSLRKILVLQAAIVAFNFSVFLVVLVVAVCIFDSTGSSFYKVQKAQEELLPQTHVDQIRSEFESTLQRSWKASLRRCCCCMRDSQNTQVALDEVSHLLRDFFRDLDIVPSDILAGMILLRHKQQCVESDKVFSDPDVAEYLTGHPITSDTSYYDPTDPREKERYENMIYYCSYAIASYGPLFYMLYHPGTGCCKLVNQCLCIRCCKQDQRTAISTAVIEEDKCCEWETSAILQALKGNVDNCEMVYASWNNDLYKQPFFICVDHHKKAIVVTIRGTLSELDALTDIVATAACIPGEHLNESWKCHKGIMNGALYIKQKLLDEMVLSQALGRDQSRGTREYQLVLVGHSLGAGIAAVLSIILRPHFPRLVCYSYSPPGGLLSLAAMEGSKDYINTVVYGKDVIPRTGLPQLQKMRNEIVELLKRCKLPKYRIIMGNMFKATQSRHHLLPQDADVEGGDRLLLNNLDRNSVDVEYEKLYPPGRILHIVYKKSNERKCCFIGEKIPSSYYAIKADNQKDFNEILISHNMVTHHWPQELLKALKKVCNTSLNDEIPRKYSKSATIPSHARLPRSNADEHSKLLHTTNSHPPDLVVPALSREAESDTMHRVDRVENHPSPDHCSETGAAHVDCTPTASSSVSNLAGIADTVEEPSVSELAASVKNDNGNNNTDEEETSNENSNTALAPTTDPCAHNSSDEDTADSVAANNSSVGVDCVDRGCHSASFLHHFGDYLDVVLPDPSALPDDASETSLSKYGRSQSMPVRTSTHRIDLDRKTMERAKFEPNLIPKPPRSNSTSRRRPHEIA